MSFWCFNSGADPAQSPPGAEAFGGKLYNVHYAKLFNPQYIERCSAGSLCHELWRRTGKADLMTLCFAIDHPHYQHVWAVEYDVHFQGLWTFFFNRFAASKADLIGTLLGPMDDLPANVQVMPPAFHDEAGDRPASGRRHIGLLSHLSHEPGVPGNVGRLLSQRLGWPLRVYAWNARKAPRDDNRRHRR